MDKKYKKWTEDEIIFLKNNSGLKTDEEISVVLGFSVRQIRYQRSKLGIKKICGRGRCGVQGETYNVITSDEFINEALGDYL